MFKCSGMCSECGRCHNLTETCEDNNRKTEIFKLPINFEADEGKGYGVAFDIGTTTVVGILWDFNEKKALETVAKTNPQRIYGLDVISRISYSLKEEGNLKILHDSIIKCINDILEELCNKAKILPIEVSKIAVCGNTTMSHIFAGRNLKALALSPYKPNYIGPLDFHSKDIGINISPEGRVLLIPNIDGHVGGDITAGIVASNLLSYIGLTMFIDIGTNGEIVMTTGDKAVCCSTAAGPAFEGAEIYQGMRATSGAIEKIVINENDVLFQTIDRVPPIGLCGSGIIDAIAQMLDIGLINRTGRILSREEYEKENPGSNLIERIREGKHGREFVLVGKLNDEDLVINQKDIRQVQLAKGAIMAGTEALAERLGYLPKDITKVIIAGAFGSFIDIENATRIGLLPNIGKGQIESQGNTAGTGCLMILTRKTDLDIALQIPTAIKHIELADKENFQERFMKALDF